MRVKVEQRHIDDGVRRSVTECPIAQAMWGLGFKYVEVNSKHVMFSKDCANWIEDDVLPAEAQCFLNDYDMGLHVEPFEFELDEEAC